MFYNGKSAETTSYKLLENTPYVIELTALLRDEFKDIFKKPFDEEMLYYMKLMQIVKKGTGFLAKTYNVNPHDVINFFVFRQRELIQRSIEVYGEYYLSLSKEKLKSYGIFETQNMLEAKGILWEIEPLQYQRGFFYINDDEGNDMQIDREIPIIADNTLYLKGDY